MKPPKITDLAKRVGKDQDTLYRWKRDNKALFKMLWKGYLITLLNEDELLKD